jgi:hypothetical protein
VGRDRVRNELLQRRLQRDARREEAEQRLGAWVVDELFAARGAAQNEATEADELCCRLPGTDPCAAYRAAQDRADQAQDPLWQQHVLERAANQRQAWLA